MSDLDDLVALVKALEAKDANLRTRDDFLVQHDLWSKFTSWLHTRAGSSFDREGEILRDKSIPWSTIANDLQATLSAKGAIIDEALDIAHRYGGIDGGHHKMWVIDQMVRALIGNEYEAWVVKQKAGEDGPETYEWDPGIAP
jgi:hypothetical protein